MNPPDLGQPSPKARHALVTGAAGSIGRATVIQLVRAGVTVVAGVRRADRLSADDPLLLMSNVEVVDLDVSASAAVEAIASRIISERGGVDILVNNAGVYLDRPERGRGISNWDPDLLSRTLEVNAVGPLRLMRALLPAMRARGYGRIVNVSSGMARFDDLDDAGAFYRISKVALNAATAIVARSVGPDEDILVNAVCPGWVRGSMGGEAASRSPEQGAMGVTWAALLAAGGPTGGFFRDGALLDWCARTPPDLEEDRMSTWT